jgi:hypothetical protein
MKNREKVLEKLRSKKERLNNIEKDLLEGRSLAGCLFSLDFDAFFCRGCEWREEEIDCEKCAKDWLREENEI